MRNKNAAIIFIFITVLVDVIGFGIIIPVIPTLIVELTGLDLSGASTYAGGLMIAFAAILVPLMLIPKQFIIGRYKGMLLFGAYIVFICIALK